MPPAERKARLENENSAGFARPLSRAMPGMVMVTSIPVALLHLFVLVLPAIWLVLLMRAGSGQDGPVVTNTAQAHQAQTASFTSGPTSGPTSTLLPESGGVGIWSAGTGARAGSYQHHDQVTGIDYSPDGCRLASAGWDGQVLQVPTCMKELMGLAQQYAGRSLTQQERSLYLGNVP